MNKILVIDDEKLIREGLKEMLTRSGYIVMVACNGKEAKMILNENPQDLIITDIIMPESDGIEVILEVKKKYHETKIIAISGGGRLPAQDHLNIAKQFGIDHALIKPFSSDELLMQVKTLLARKQPE